MASPKRRQKRDMNELMKSGGIKFTHYSFRFVFIICLLLSTKRGEHIYTWVFWSKNLYNRVWSWNGSELFSEQPRESLKGTKLTTTFHHSQHLFVFFHCLVNVIWIVQEYKNTHKHSHTHTKKYIDKINNNEKKIYTTKYTWTTVYCQYISLC